MRCCSPPPGLNPNVARSEAGSKAGTRVPATRWELIVLPPWKDLFVVQIGDSIACAYSAKLLVELGAECVLIESPSDPDPVRTEGVEEGWSDAEAGPLFTYLNWSKQSITCDYSRPDGIDVLNGICSSADIVVRGEMPADAEAYWQATADARPKSLIELVITPFGTTGPYVGYKADSAAILALCGVTYTDGDPDREPLTIQPDIAEYFVGADGFASVLAGLHWRQQTGEGTHVELAMYDSVLKFDECNLLFPQTVGTVRKRFYSRRPDIYTPDMFECRDGYVTFVVRGNGQDTALLIERPDLIDTPLFTDPMYRLRHWDELDALMSPWLKSHDRDEIVTRAQQLRINAAPIFGVEDLTSSEHVHERAGIRLARDVWGREVALVAPPFRLASHDPPGRPAPRRGDHTHKWLQSGSTAERREGDQGQAGPHVTVSPSRKLPLEGIRVLDFTHVWAGPAATRILADLGADVIKVEGPSRMDMTRTVPLGTFMDNDVSGDFWNRSPYFQNRNQNKRAIAVDLGTEAGRDLIRQLVQQCDALVENFTPRVMPNFGLDYPALSALNHQLVMVSMAGYGARGAFAGYSAAGMTLNCASGIASGNGYPGGPPMKSGTAFMDMFAGVCAAAAIMAALLERERMGRGQWVDLSQHEVGISAIGAWFAEYARTGRRVERRGNRSRQHAPQGIYPCRGDDAWIYISIRNDDQWRELCAVLGDERLADEPYYGTPRGRLAHHDELDARLGELTRSFDKFGLMSALQARGVIAVAVLDGEEVLQNAQLQEREMFEPITFEGATRAYMSHRYVGARFDRFAARSLSRAPSLGEHNREVLQGLCGLSDAEYKALEASGVIGNEPQFGLPVDEIRAALRFPAEQVVRAGAARWGQLGAGNRNST